MPYTRTAWVEGGAPGISATNLNKIEAGIAQAHWYGTTTNTGNAYAVTLSPAPVSFAELTGVPVRVQCNVNSTGALTLNVNTLGAKVVKSSFGVATATWKAGSIYTLVYNGTDFILQGEGGEYGTAVAADVLAPKTIGTDAGLVTGTMVDRGTVNITPSGVSQTIAAGKHSGSGAVAAVVVPVANVKAGTTIAGQAGTMPVIGADTAGSAPNGFSTVGRLYTRVPVGYWDGVKSVWADDPDFIAANILAGKDIFGLLGTLVPGRQEASGTVTSSAGTLSFTDYTGAATSHQYVTVTGLAFTPRIIELSMDIAPGVTIDTDWTGFSGFKIIQYATESTGKYIRLSGNAYITGGSFQLPFPGASQNVRWKAFS